MTESEWLAFADPTAMLEAISTSGDPVTDSMGRLVSDRKLRLFACACCRQIWHLLADERSRQAVEVAERYVDGEASDKERDVARDAAWDAAWDGAWDAAWAGAWTAAGGGAWDAARGAAGAATWSAAQAGAKCAAGAAARVAAWSAARVVQTVPLRDIVNPFRPVAISRDWLTPSARGIAQVAYEDRLPDGTLDPVSLAVLSDALEEAGCGSSDLLAHLRSPGPHVRGCWAVDLVLGRE